MSGPDGPVEQDVDRPIFHIMGARGWLNDPNGPIFFNGMYHLFFQHLPTGCEWDWGLVWGHAVSRDLVHWHRLPPAVVPSEGFLDADGCFSGCCTIDANGVPTILYTGVRLRSNPACGPLPPPEHDLQLPFIESQLIAVGDPNDEMLQTWHKVKAPFIALPPESELTGWRDPLVLQRGGNGKEWVLLIGAGIKGKGGTTLIYKAADLYAEWQLYGRLCMGDESMLGQMWECPLLALLPPVPPRGRSRGGSNGVNGAGADGRWNHHARDRDCDSDCGSDGGGEPDDGFVFSRPCDLPPPTHSGSEVPEEGLLFVNGSRTPSDNWPRPFFYCISPDAPHNPSLYWMGSYDHDKIAFDLAGAVGPFRLDLGDTIYAPNILEDPHGRKILWCWVQETRRRLGTYTYAGCMATPRVLLRRGDSLVLQPLPELVDIRRRGVCERWRDVMLPEWVRVPLTGVSGRTLDLELTFRRGDALITGLVLHSWNAGGEGSAALLFDWESHQLEVMFEALDPETLQFSLSAPNATRIGGKIEHEHGDALHLRVLLDHSLLEVFTGNGQSLTTRVYRGVAPLNERGLRDLGVDFLSLGGSACLERMAAYEMESIWERREVPKTRHLDAAQPATIDSVAAKVEALALGGLPPVAPRVEAGILAG